MEGITDSQEVVGGGGGGGGGGAETGCSLVSWRGLVRKQ